MSTNAILFRCPECGKAYGTTPRKRGTWHQCAQCGVYIQVPLSSEDLDVTSSPEGTGELDRDGEVELVETDVASSSWLSDAGKWSIGALGLLVAGLVTIWIWPVLLVWLVVAYAVAGVVLLGASWVMGFRHACRNDKIAAALFFYRPLYFVKYGMRNWPETRSSMMTLAVFFVWIIAPMAIVIPVNLIAGLFPNTGADGTRVVNQQSEGQHQSGGTPAPAPSNLPPSKKNPDSTQVVNIPQRTTTTTVTSKDGKLSSSTTTNTSTITKRVPRGRESSSRQQSIALLRQLKELHHQIGSFMVLEVTGANSGIVWGGKENVYKFDSDPQIAAVHAGIVKVGQTAKVKITAVDGPIEYPSITRNGISSYRWPSDNKIDPNGFKIELASDKDPLTTSPLPDPTAPSGSPVARDQQELRSLLSALRFKPGKTVMGQVTGSVQGSIWGGANGIYTSDSDPNVAAVHSGLVKVGQSKMLKFTSHGRQDDLPAIEQNGIKSRRWPTYPSSFKIELATEDDLKSVK